MLLRSILSTACLAAAITLSGCSFLSIQKYGSNMRMHTISEGQSRAAVLANLGEPSAIFHGSGEEIFIYRNYYGQNYLGLYSQVDRYDLVVVMDSAGTVQLVNRVEVGKGYTIIPSPIHDHMQPIPSFELRRDPAYSFEGTIRP